MKKGKTIKTLILPEEVIHHIQSFMSGKEAARTTVLSKSWYTAWLTRPTIDIAHDDFYRIHNSFPKRCYVFEEFARKTMQRYEGLSLKIESFSVRGFLRSENQNNLIVNAMKLGATDLHLNLHWPSRLPQEVLGSETLLRLAAFWFEIDGEYVIRCSRLKSLRLERVKFRTSERFKDIMISCCDSLEELSLTLCYGLALNLVNLNELRKLRRLYLKSVDVDSMFFTDFASRFPYLKDLTIHNCNGYTKIHIASTSLQTISLKHDSLRESNWAEFDVPNIRKFVYLGDGLPSQLSVNGALKEWEFDISIACGSLYDSCWFKKLKRSLKEFRLSRISLYIHLNHWRVLREKVPIKQ